MATNNRLFGVFFIFFLVGIVVLYAATVDYDENTSTTSYASYQDLHVMTFIGLGFLLTLLSRNGLSAVSHSLLIAAFVILWYILCRGFFEGALSNIPKRAIFTNIKVSLESLLFADYAAFAVLITFGALIGRLSAGQLLIVALFETIFYAFQENIVYSQLKIVDSGRAMSVHAFGAFFGVFTALVVDLDNDRKKLFKDAVVESTKTSNITSMLGALFLWVFFPSFNSAVLSEASDVQRAVINTVLAIASSTIVTFALLTIVYHDKFRMLEVQNAAIAGGVSIAAIAPMTQGPHASLIVGAIGGAVAIAGYRYVQPFLANAIGLRDSRGVLSAHGLTGLVGGITGVIVSRVATEAKYPGSFDTVWKVRVDNNRSGEEQAKYQLAAVAVSLAFALFGGITVGVFLRLIPSLNKFYDDDEEYVAEVKA